MNTSKKFKDRYYNKYDNYEHIYCSYCGKSSYFIRNCKAICSVCGNIIYPSKRSEFKDKMEKLMRRMNNE